MCTTSLFHVRPVARNTQSQSENDQNSNSIASNRPRAISYRQTCANDGTIDTNPLHSSCEYTDNIMPKKSPTKAQGTLFSFFSRKEPPNKPQKDEIPIKDQVHDFPKKPDSDATLHSVKQVDLGKKVPRATKQLTPAQTSSVSGTNNQNNCSKRPMQPSQALVGKHVKVYWPDDQAWYLGKVIDYSRQDGKHTIHYADGDKERVTLANEKVSKAMLCIVHQSGIPMLRFLTLNTREYCADFSRIERRILSFLPLGRTCTLVS